jgi:hypothetical protein
LPGLTTRADSGSSRRPAAQTIDPEEHAMRNPISALARKLGHRRLKEGPVPNNLQLCTSKHLGDYQWLFVGVAVLFVLAMGLLANDLSVIDREANSLRVTIAFALITTAVTMFNWVYQSANSRLGIVDLFASEIAALCKVCLVTDFAKKSVAMRTRVQLTGSQTPDSFEVSESYTPVYDKSGADLQSLDSNVVAAVTQFYTYRRTMVDCLHSAMAKEDAKVAIPLYDQMIYMQFLMYECGRTAIHELVEFEPDQAENLVTVLCSELPLITFLIQRHRGDADTVFLYRRLRLRVPDYMKEVNKLLDGIKRMDRSQDSTLKKGWSRAITTSKELKGRFEEFKRATQQEWEWFQAKEKGLDKPDPGQPALPQAA